jgi:hypothetical protein
MDKYGMIQPVFLMVALTCYVNPQKGHAKAQEERFDEEFVQRSGASNIIIKY